MRTNAYPTILTGDVTTHVAALASRTNAHPTKIVEMVFSQAM